MKRILGGPRVIVGALDFSCTWQVLNSDFSYVQPIADSLYLTNTIQGLKKKVIQACK